MKIRYIIDYKGFGSFYQLTNTRNGECLDISKEQAKGYLDASDVFFSGKAEVALKSLPQREVKRPLGYSMQGAKPEYSFEEEKLPGAALQPYSYSFWS